jgi:putative heme degradation protein
MTVTAQPRTRAQLLLALSRQDWPMLDGLMDDLADELGEQPAQDYLRNALLPHISTASVEAFWRHVMTADQFDDLMEKMAMATTHRLEAEGFQLGKDFSYSVRDDGLRQLLCNDTAKAVLATLYEGPRFSTLRILLA